MSVASRLIDEVSLVRIFKIIDLADTYGGTAIQDVPGSIKATFKKKQDAAEYAMAVTNKYDARIDIRGNNVFVYEQ